MSLLGGSGTIRRKAYGRKSFAFHLFLALLLRFTTGPKTIQPANHEGSETMSQTNLSSF
jgi:hypothetical protein